MSRKPSSIHALLALDKTAGPSSHDMVARARRALGERRIGHAGTLDPAATGVLVLGIGQATRLLGLLSSERKRYEALISFGVQTSTDDAQGEPLLTKSCDERIVSESFAAAYLAALIGSHDQVPPAVSALSIEGKRAYKRARAGEQFELKPRTVQIYDAKLLQVEQHEEAICWRVALEVSKGFYVRSFARDLGIQLGGAAHLATLRRHTAGLVGLADCVSADELENSSVSDLRKRFLNPVTTLGIDAYELSEPELNAAMNGRPLEIAGTGRRALVYQGRLMGVWQHRGSQLVCVTNFPAGIEGVRA